MELIDSKLNYIGVDRLECADKYTYENIDNDWPIVLSHGTKQDKLEYLISLITHAETLKISDFEIPYIQKVVESIVKDYIHLI